MGDKFWYNDYTILFEKDRLIEFIPNNTMTLTEKLNSLVRFSIYLAIILFIYNRKYYVFYIRRYSFFCIYCSKTFFIILN